MFAHCKLKASSNFYSTTQPNRDYFRHQKKLDEIKLGRTRRNISFFQSEDVKQNQKIKKNSFNYRNQEQQMNLYKQNTKMFFKLLNISTNSNFSTIPQPAINGGFLSNQNKSQQKIYGRDLSLNNELLADLQNFEKNGQLEQVIEDQTNKQSSENQSVSGVTAPAPQRQSLNTQNRKRNSVSPTNANQSSITQPPPSAGQIQISSKQNDFLDKIYKENLVLHQRLLDMDSVLNKKNFDKFHTQHLQYKNRLQKFQVDTSTQKVKIKGGTYINKFVANNSSDKLREEIHQKKNSRSSSSPNQDEDFRQQAQLVEDTIISKENNSMVKVDVQKQTASHPKSFFTEIEMPYDNSVNKLNQLKVNPYLKSKTRDQSLVKNNIKMNFESQEQIKNKRKHPSQIEIGVQSYLRNSRPKTNNTISGNGRGSSYYNQRAHTTSHSDQNDTLAHSNAMRDRSLQDLKNRSGDYLQAHANKPNSLQTQKMDHQFKNFFSTSARSVSAQRNQSIVRNNLANNTNNQKKAITINSSNINLQQYHQQMKNNNEGNSTRNNGRFHQTGLKNNQQMYYNTHSLNNSSLNKSNLNNSFHRADVKYNNFNTNQHKNNYNSTANNSYSREKSLSKPHMSKSALQDKQERFAVKHITYTPQQIPDEQKMEEYKKQYQDMYKQYKISFEQISPYSNQNHSKVEMRRRVQTVHHSERKNETGQSQKPYPRIQREKLVPLSQVKEEDHLQQTLEGKRIQLNKNTIPEQISI